MDYLNLDFCNIFLMYTDSSPYLGFYNIQVNLNYYNVLPKYYDQAQYPDRIQNLVYLPISDNHNYFLTKIDLWHFVKFFYMHHNIMKGRGHSNYHFCNWNYWGMHMVLNTCYILDFDYNKKKVLCLTNIWDH